MSIEEEILKIKKEIPLEVNLVIAVKYATPEGIKEVLRCGVKDLGFNTYQQMEETCKNFIGKINAHFIGHIQTNKARKIILERPFLIQSVDSFKLAEKLNSICEERSIFQDILIQIKTDEEKEKGFEIEEGEIILKEFEKKFKNLKVRGFMTIPPQTTLEELKKIFSKMKNIFDSAEKTIGRKLDYLSMGMSQDYKIAIKNGANMIRIGRQILS
jgi:pyridoxal phosphate enzyme (YggS family)